MLLALSIALARRESVCHSSAMPYILGSVVGLAGNNTGTKTENVLFHKSCYPWKGWKIAACLPHIGSTPRGTSQTQHPTTASRTTVIQTHQAINILCAARSKLPTRIRTKVVRILFVLPLVTAGRAS